MKKNNREKQKKDAEGRSKARAEAQIEMWKTLHDGPSTMHHNIWHRRYEAPVHYGSSTSMMDAKAARLG